ncbi:ester cyclase, partial [Streptomyces sp. NPDC048845]|uniref:ester cyclase n=1 Tax=Streptomyces sp. NPDC048845 TaxID=3155390 RepID=UPI00344A4155
GSTRRAVGGGSWGSSRPGRHGGGEGFSGLGEDGDRTVIRPERYQSDLLATVGPFPDARFKVQDIQTNHSERYAGLRVAVLWTMHGTYRGTPAFGPLTDRPVTVLGVSQFLVQGGRIVREFRVYDEISLRAQINSVRGDGPPVAANIY